MKDRLQMRIDSDLKRQAMRSATRRHMTLSELVEKLLRKVTEDDALAHKTNALADDVPQV